MKLWDTGADLDPLVEEYTTGEDPVLDGTLVPWDIHVNLAHSRVLERLGILTHDEVEAIRGALTEILARHEKGEPVLQPGDEDVHTAIERELTERLGDAGRKIHTGRSRNEQVLTDIRLHLKDGLLELGIETAALARCFLAQARRFEGLPMPGYTHLQRAMPSSVTAWLSSFAEALIEDLGPVRCAIGLADRCPLGTGAGYGVPLPLDRELAARLLGFSRVQRSAVDAQGSRGRAEAAALGAMAQIARDLARFSWDMVLFTSSEFGFFRLPERFTTGSSLMPQKRNPDVFELMRAHAARVRACLVEVLDVTGALPSGYHRDLQLTKGPLLRGLALTRSTVRVVAHVLPEIEPLRDRLEAALTPEVHDASRAIALAVRMGVPFREAHRRIARGGAAPAPEVLPDGGSALGSPDHLDLESLEREIEEWDVRLRRDSSELRATLERLRGGRD